MPATRLPYVGLDSPARDGVVLHGATPETVAADLIDTVLGPAHPHRNVLDTYVGLGPDGLPAPTAAHVEGATPGRVYWLVEHVRVTGRTAIVPPLAWPGLSHVSADRVATNRRRRITQLLGSPPLALAAGRPHWWSSQLGHATRVGIRVLAAAGPLTLPQLSAAVARSSRRCTTSVSDWHLVAGLSHRGARIDPATGRWSADQPAAAPDAALIAAATVTGQAVHRRGQIRQLLITAGALPSTGSDAQIDSHPLLIRVGRGRYQVLGVDEHPLDIDQEPGA